MKILKKLYIPFIAGILAITGFLMPAVNIEYNSDTGLHIGTAITASAGSDKVQAVAMKDTLSYAKLEKSGCQIGKDGLIYLRYDLYLLPGAPGFNDWYITAAEQQAADIKDGISTKGKVYEDYNSPYLCVFVTVPSTITAEEVKTLGNEIVNKSYAGFIANRNVMTSVSELRPVLKAAKAVSYVADSKKSVLTKYDALVALTDDITIAELNPSEADTKNIRVIVGKQELPVYAGDPIDVGSAAVDRNNTAIMTTGSLLINNPANANGLLDTVEIWVANNSTVVKVGTFSNISSTTFVNRDYALLGSITAGAKRTFTGLSIEVSANDLIGYKGSSGYIEMVESGNGRYYSTADIFDGANHNFTLQSNTDISLYATGETAGGTPTITNSIGESNVTATAARLNGELTDDGGATTTVTVYWGDNDGGTTAGNWDNNYSLGTQAEGTFYHDVSSLSSGTTYYYRYYASNSYGGAWASSTESFLTKPAAPTNVSATDGTHTDKVVITWTKSTGATGYKIYEGSNLLGTVGDVATFDDTTAAAPTITAGAAVASDGTSGAYVALSLSGNSISNGASGTYKVVAVNATGDSADSSADNGYRGHGDLTYQWQVSAADSDASYSDISGGTTDPYNYTGAPPDEEGRYYKCILSATGASNQTTSADRGYRATFVAPTVTSLECLGFGSNWAILGGTIVSIGDDAITQVGIDYGLATTYNYDEIVDATKVYIDGDKFVIKIEGLTNATVYHYRAKANNGAWGLGNDLMFSTKGSPVIYEYISSGNDGDSDSIYEAGYSAQSFTVGATGHTITSVNLLIKRVGNPGTITVSLKHANESLLPTGDDIATATMDGDLIGTVYAWYKFTFETEEPLIAGNAYAIVVKANVGDSENYVKWASDTGGALGNGIGSSSTDAGINWSSEAPADYLFEIWGNPSISVEGAAVFENYNEIGDMLFLIAYKNVYAPYYPYEDPMKYFTLQILDTDGLTVMHQIACKSWEYMPTAIYLSADTASGLTQGSAYYVRLYGNFTGNPSSSYALTSTDWIGDSEISLKQWIWSAAYAMEDYYGVTLTTVLDGKTVLNETGGALFNSSIPLLGSLMPDIFITIPYDFNFEDIDWVNAFEAGYDWEDLVGTQVTEWADAGSEIFGVDSKTMIGLCLLIAYLIIGVGFFAAGHSTAGLAISFPFIAAAGVIQVIDIQLIGVIAIVMAGLFVWSIFWK